MNDKHTQVPNNMNDLNNVDLIVYAAIKSYKIGNNPCFVSQETIAKKLNLTRPTVKKAITNLADKEYITVTRKGKMSYYEFSKYKKFEPFSDDFINNSDLDAKIKGYLIGNQQLMFKDIKGIGKTTLTTKELANNVNISERTVNRYEKELIKKGYLTIVNTSDIDSLTGIKKTERIYNLEKLGQAIVWKLKEHDEKINKNSEDIEKLKQDNINLKKQLDILINHMNFQNSKVVEEITL